MRDALLRPAENRMNLLPVRLPNHVGDACMALPAIRLIADAGFVPLLVGRPWAQDLFAGLGWPSLVLQGRLLADSRTLREQVGRQPLHALLFPNSLSSALLFKLARLRSAGAASGGRRWLLDVAVAPARRGHEVERFFAVAVAALRAWDRPPALQEPPPTLGLSLTADDIARADALLREHSVPSRFALVAPVATGLHHGQVKQWPHFERLVRELMLSGVPSIAVPTAHEASATAAAVPSARLLPPVSLGILAAIAQRATVVLANDSGVSHLAAAVGAPQVTLIGVTDPARTGPWSPRAVCAGAPGRWPSVEQALAAVEAAMRK
jgi:heptosyltransferase II